MADKAKSKLVMVFGTFDSLHSGHLNFFKQAKHFGTVLAVVARDSTVKILKNKTPRQNERQRLTALRGIQSIYKTSLGDKKLGSYLVIKKYKPAVICLGYDQTWLRSDLEEKISSGILPKIKLIILKPHMPDKLHTSLLTGK